MLATLLITNLVQAESTTKYNFLVLILGDSLGQISLRISFSIALSQNFVDNFVVLKFICTENFVVLKVKKLPSKPQVMMQQMSLILTQALEEQCKDGTA